jgi:hypothetical protein
MASAIGEHLKRVAVAEALSRHGIGHSTKLAEQLQNEAEIPENSHDIIVKTISGVSLDERIRELSRSAKFASDIPAAAPEVSAGDQVGLSQNFDAIASGKVRVTN